ncbi:MAG: hypothetical protein AAF573_15020 [Bacteroidota bacterium]
MMKKFLLFLFLFNFSILLAQDSEKERTSKHTFFDYISSNAEDDIFKLTIKADFDTLINYKKKIVNYLPAEISLHQTEQEIITLDGSIRPRGKFRRRVCDFPPIRLKIRKKGLKEMGLRGKHNTFKVVTHCLEDTRSSKENILREYLSYKIYNIHSEQSLRTQLVKITYVQSGSEKKLFERYGIIIENGEEMAERFNGNIEERFSCPVDSVNTYSSTVQAMFQCMIGNADWSYRGMRNVKMFSIKDQEKFNVFPYDFDCSGLVDAEYAIPNPDYKLVSTKERVFLGKISSPEELQKVAKLFLDKKEETIALVKNFKKLSKRSRKDIVRYLNSFYEILDDEDKLSEEIQKLSPAYILKNKK